MRRIEGYLLMQAIDTRWKEHLHSIDALKHGIGLRGYAQRDPKNEYKQEAFALFQRLFAMIEDHVASLLLRLEVGREPPQRAAAAPARAPGPLSTAPPARPVSVRDIARVPAGAAFDQFAQSKRLHEALQAQKSAALSAAGQMSPGPRPADGARSDGASSPAATPGPPQPAPAAPRTAPRPFGARSAAAAFSFSRGAPARAAGRNDPCPCGSGQKYKKCHGKGA
jgi:preprotein translocase subunit SecA